MRITRIYINSKIALNNAVTIKSQAAQHLIKVLRCKTDDKIILFNGDGGEFVSTIKDITKKEVIAIPTEFKDDNKTSFFNLHLGQALSRNEKMDLVIQKAVELGVRSITPIITHRSNIKLDKQREDNKIEHWHKVIASAAEQCGCNILPHLNHPASIIDWVNLYSQQDITRIAFAPNAELKLSEIKCNTAALVLIGPEGGFAADEITVCQQLHFQITSMGPRVLRTETAAITALSVLQHKFGDLQ